MAERKKRYPLPKRFNVALSEEAYGNLRALNERWSLGNNYLLEVLLMNLDKFADQDALDTVFSEFVGEWGAPNRKVEDLKT